MKRVFISFAMEDKKQVDGVRLLSWHQHVDLEFYDESVRTPYDGTDAAYIRRRIREKIARSSVTLCLLGTATHKSHWVDWELRTSMEMGRRIVIMGLPNGPPQLIMPPSVRGRTWYIWDIPTLQSLLNDEPVALPRPTLGWY